VHSPLGITAQGSYIAPRRAARTVHSADRLWDALSMLLILAGTTLFLLARSSLASTTDVKQLPPPGFTSWVQRADYFTAQSSLGLVMVGIGVGVGIWSAIRNAMRRRAGQPSVGRSV